MNAEVESWFYIFEMVIFFGASSGMCLGNVTVKRPFSMVALISSSCKMIQVNRNLKLFKKSDIPVHLEVVEGYARTCRGDVRVMNIRCPSDSQTS